MAEDGVYFLQKDSPVQSPNAKPVARPVARRPNRQGPRWKAGKGASSELVVGHTPSWCLGPCCGWLLLKELLGGGMIRHVYISVRTQV